MEYSIVPQMHSIYCPVYTEIENSICCYTQGCPLYKDDITHLHFHKCLEIGICLNGHGNCIIENRLYRYKAGDIQIVLPFQPHYANSDPDVAATWIWLSYDPYKLTINDSFRGTICNVLEKRVNFSGVFSPDEHIEAANIIKKCIEEISAHRSLSQLYTLILVQQLVIELSRIDSPLQNNIAERRRSFDKILPAIEHISKNLCNPNELTLDILAKKCFISISTLRRYFYKFTDASPQQFIAKTRISNAQYMLNNTEMSITEISENVGFESISCFTRAFRRILGVTPSEYRSNGFVHI